MAHANYEVFKGLAGSQVALDWQRENSQEMRDYYNEPSTERRKSKELLSYEYHAPTDCYHFTYEDGVEEMPSYYLGEYLKVMSPWNLEKAAPVFKAPAVVFAEPSLVPQDLDCRPGKMVLATPAQLQMRGDPSAGRESLRAALIDDVLKRKYLGAPKTKASHAHFEPREDRNCMVGWDGARE